MRSWLMSNIQGYVVCRIRGKKIHRFINRISEERLQIWNIRFRAEDECTLYVSVDDFFRLRPILRETDCRIRIHQRVGLPFHIHKWLKRKSFIIGSFLFFITLYVMSSMIWSVEVKGVDPIQEREILQVAKKFGLEKGGFKTQLLPLDELRRSMLQSLNGVAWVGVDITGTKVKIEIVEQTRPKEKALQNPRNLVASKDAVIVKILAVKGKPMVKVNQRVGRGDILISGYIGDEENHAIVVAEGQVKGLVWYKTTVTLPLVQERRELTGNSMNRSYLVIGNRALKLDGYGKVPFQAYESKWDEKWVEWRNYRLPVRWLDEKVMEVNVLRTKLSIADALNLAKARARDDVLLKAGSEAKIESEKVLRRDVQNDKVVLTLLFEVVENIAQEQPIIQGD